MSISERFLRNFGTNNFSGITLGNWWKVLRDNRFSIDPAYLPRAALTTLNAIPNTLTACAERWLYEKSIRQTEVAPPLFVLGAWRSGTTHLHNLLAIDQRFAYPNLYQITYPLTFLLTEKSTAWFIDLCMPKQRPQDAVKLGINEPQEEDFVMCSLAGQSVMFSWAFPRNAAFYHRYMTMAGLSPEERARWKADYEYFVKKLTLKYGRPLVLKSPANTGRIQILLELFPNARFVHIHRNPYDIFRSLRHTLMTAGRWWQMQRRNYADDDAINAQLIEQVKTLYDSYFAQCSMIPGGRLHQVAFTDMERDPLGELRKTYDALELPDFEQAEQPIKNYLNSLHDYRKNTFRDLPESSQKRLQREWQRYFDEWRYAKELRKWTDSLATF